MPVRPATEADLHTILALRLAFIADVRGVEAASFDEAFVEATRRYLDAVTAADRIRSWLAEDEHGEAVGVVSVLANDAPPLPEVHLRKEGYVVNMWVAPSARRQGLARALLGAAMAAAPAEGWRRLYLHATDDGLPLYEQAGFEPDRRWMGLSLATP